MKKKNFFILLFIVVFLFLYPFAHPHSINYEVLPKGISVKVFYSEKEPASYSEYEIYGPGENQPHQIGRSDKNGFVSFFPDKAGIWKIKIWGESSHGFHGVTMDVKVNEVLGLESYSKPLVATHTKLLIGISLIFGLFGIYALLRSRKSIVAKAKS